MKRHLAPILWVAAISVMAACSSDRAQTRAPRDQANICALLDQEDDWGEALSDTVVKWGAPPHVVMAIIWKESSFRAKARTPRKYTMFGLIPNGRVSSAYGYSQAVDGTWDWYRKETGNSWASRTEFDDSVDFIGWYMAKTRRSNALAMDDAFGQYLAYHQGHTGYRKGAWRDNAWLKGAAAKVARRAARYKVQLGRCGDRVA